MKTRTRTRPHVTRCVRCGGDGRHRGRRLCAACWCQLQRRGELWRYARQTRPVADTVADYRLLRERGLTYAETAEKLGLTVRGLEGALGRARKKGIL